MAKKAPPGFNTPFRDLKKAPPSPAAPTRRPSPPPASAPKPPAADDDDARLFQQAMRGVTPLAAAERAQRASPLGPPVAPPPRAALRLAARREDALAEAALVELVAKPGRLTVEETGESVAGFASGVDRRLLRRLGAGDYPIEVEIDLHGLDRVAAAAALGRAGKD